MLSSRHASTVLVVVLLAVACGGGGDGTFGRGMLEEAPDPGASASGSWWLSSGARFFRDGDAARTIHGVLPEDDSWRSAYAQSNSLDTDGGARPQNVLRLIHRAARQDVTTSLRFRVRTVNASASPNRNASNGVFLFLRFLDGDHFYAAGIRVDGNAVVKRKIAGDTVTLDATPFFPGAYDRDERPRLLPGNQWIELRATASGAPSGGTRIVLAVDGIEVLDVVDDDTTLARPGLGGVRGDFMDLDFAGYRFD